MRKQTSLLSVRKSTGQAISKITGTVKMTSTVTIVLNEYQHNYYIA